MSLSSGSSADGLSQSSSRIEQNEGKYLDHENTGYRHPVPSDAEADPKAIDFEAVRNIAVDIASIAQKQQENSGK